MPVPAMAKVGAELAGAAVQWSQDKYDKSKAALEKAEEAAFGAGLATTAANAGKVAAEAAEATTAAVETAVNDIQASLSGLTGPLADLTSSSITMAEQVAYMYNFWYIAVNFPPTDAGIAIFDSEIAFAELHGSHSSLDHIVVQVQYDHVSTGSVQHHLPNPRVIKALLDNARTAAEEAAAAHVSAEEAEGAAVSAQTAAEAAHGQSVSNASSLVSLGSVLDGMVTSFPAAVATSIQPVLDLMETAYQSVAIFSFDLDGRNEFDAMLLAGRIEGGEGSMFVQFEAEPDKWVPALNPYLFTIQNASGDVFNILQIAIDVLNTVNFRPGHMG